MNQEALSLLSIATSLVLSMLAVFVSVQTYRNQKLDNSYSDIDDAYFQTLQLAIEHPELRDRERTATYFELPSGDEARLRYEAYAYICCNIAETIYDRQGDKSARFGVSPTWLPVMIEENRLHYHWFRRNARLFKARYVRFVMDELNQLEVTEGTTHDLHDMYPCLTRDFPAEELVSRSHLADLLERGEYKLYLAKHATLGIVVGYAFMYEPKLPRIAWLDYIAIDPQYRNAGFGTVFIEHLCERMQRQRLGMMLEVEVATSDDPQTRAYQQRRIAFYGRVGAKQLNVPYLYPAQGDPYPMHLFFKPLAKLDRLPGEHIRAMITAAYDYIHDDVPNRHAILQRFISTVQDAPLQ